MKRLICSSVIDSSKAYFCDALFVNWYDSPRGRSRNCLTQFLPRLHTNAGQARHRQPSGRTRASSASNSPPRSPPHRTLLHALFQFRARADRLGPASTNGFPSGFPRIVRNPDDEVAIGGPASGGQKAHDTAPNAYNCQQRIVERPTAARWSSRSFALWYQVVAFPQLILIGGGDQIEHASTRNGPGAAGRAIGEAPELELPLNTASQSSRAAQGSRAARFDSRHPRQTTSPLNRRDCHSQDGP